MKKLSLLLAVLGASLISQSAGAVVINVDLSGATTGTSIVAPQASFASTFSGQTISGGTGISGSPANPLTLAPANVLSVAFFDPGVSPASNSILPAPGNQGPLSVLLASAADSITWTMGFGNPPSSVDIEFFDLAGNLISNVTQNISSGYNVYTFSGLGGVFRGLTVYNNNDPAGLRFQNFSYSQVPEPLTLTLMGLGLAGIGYRRHRSRATA